MDKKERNECLLNKKVSIVSVVLIFLIIALVASVPIGRLIMDNRALKTTVASQKKEIVILQNQSKNLQSENERLLQKNQKLIKENKDLINAFNQKNEEISLEAQTGNSKPNRVGISPKFIMVSRGGFDRFDRENILEKLTEGSYQYQKEKIPFDIDDYKSWPSLGSWKMTNYTATTAECDANPSITASGQIVTPGFTVAVDPHYWPYGTIFYFKDVGFGIAADCGGYIKGRNRADYLTASKQFSMPEKVNTYLVYLPNNS